jgi:peptide-methionine (S)-S-oxide reductase
MNSIDCQPAQPGQQPEKIAFGGGCYWCTEAVFQSLRGVVQVEQGFIRSTGEDNGLSEAVIVHFEPEVISIDDLIAVHLHTHSSTSDHSMRARYRSAVYVFDEAQAVLATASISGHQQDFDQPLVTRVLPFAEFQASDAKYHNYYANNPEQAFCQTYIHPKLEMLKQRYSRHYRDVTEASDSSASELNS